MQKGDYLDTLLRSEKTVFTLSDIMLLWQESQVESARVRLNYYVKRGQLTRLRRGVYAKSEKYDKIELATRIFSPSYVTFETVLAKEGLIFQYYTDITVASYLNRKIEIDNQVYSFRKLKQTVLLNATGIEHVSERSVATKERAFLDTLYINTDYYFDNLRSINWESVFEILTIYENNKMNSKVKALYEKFKSNL